MMISSIVRPPPASAAAGTHRSGPPARTGAAGRRPRTAGTRPAKCTSGTPSSASSRTAWKPPTSLLPDELALAAVGLDRPDHLLRRLLDLLLRRLVVVCAYK